MGMNVFNWVSYGNITTYMADTPERLKSIYDKIADTMNKFTEDEQVGVERVNAWLSKQKNPSNPAILERAINNLIQEFGGTDVHETFEYGTGFDEIIDPLEDDE